MLVRRVKPSLERSESVHLIASVEQVDQQGFRIISVNTVNKFYRYLVFIIKYIRERLLRRTRMLRQSMFLFWSG